MHCFRNLHVLAKAQVCEVAERDEVCVGNCSVSSEIECRKIVFGRSRQNCVSVVKQDVYAALGEWGVFAGNPKSEMLGCARFFTRTPRRRQTHRIACHSGRPTNANTQSQTSEQSDPIEVLSRPIKLEESPSFLSCVHREESH